RPAGRRRRAPPLSEIAGRLHPVNGWGGHGCIPVLAEGVFSPINRVAWTNDCNCGNAPPAKSALPTIVRALDLGAVEAAFAARPAKASPCCSPELDDRTALGERNSLLQWGAQFRAPSEPSDESIPFGCVSRQRRP